MLTVNDHSNKEKAAAPPTGNALVCRNSCDSDKEGRRRRTCRAARGSGQPLPAQSPCSIRRPAIHPSAHFRPLTGGQGWRGKGLRLVPPMSSLRHLPSAVTSCEPSRSGRLSPRRRCPGAVTTCTPTPSSRVAPPASNRLNRRSGERVDRRKEAGAPEVPKSVAKIVDSAPTLKWRFSFFPSCGGSSAG